MGVWIAGPTPLYSYVVSLLHHDRVYCGLCGSGLDLAFLYHLKTKTQKKKTHKHYLLHITEVVSDKYTAY